MTIILNIADLQPESGGPSRTVPALAMALADIGVHVRIVTLARNGAADAGMIPQHERIKSILVPCKNNFAKLTGARGAYRRAVMEACREVETPVIHDNGLWLGTNHASATIARANRTPLMVSPRGMLTSWSLRHNGWKKKIAWWLYQQRDLQCTQVLHATSFAEARDFRAAGLTQPVAVIPNGVEVPALAQRSEAASVVTRIVFFLSRIHPKKGLLNLVNAWAIAQPKGWRVVIAGTDEDGHLAEVKAESRKRKIENDFDFVGAVEGEAKWDWYRRAGLFVLPSHSENFGLVIAEALACGVPVIATRGTPWEELITQRCGWWVENTPEALAVALLDATDRSDEERREMGARGRRVVQEKYTWPGVAAQMKTVYEWMLGRSQKPECVVV